MKPNTKPSAATTPSREAVRAELFKGLMPVREFAAAAGLHENTILKAEKRGLQIVRIARRPYVDPTKAVPFFRNAAGPAPRSRPGRNAEARAA